MFRGPDWKIIFCPSLLRLTNRSWSISYSSHEPQRSRKQRQPDRRLSTAGDIYVEQKTANVIEREIEKRIILLPTEDYSCSNHHRSILGDNKPQVDIFSFLLCLFRSSFLFFFFLSSDVWENWGSFFWPPLSPFPTLSFWMIFYGSGNCESQPASQSVSLCSAGEISFLLLLQYFLLASALFSGPRWGEKSSGGFPAFFLWRLYFFFFFLSFQLPFFPLPQR